jgi:hypothetical protein
LTTKPSKKVTPPKQPDFPIWLPLIIVAGVVLIAVAVLSNNGSSPAAPGAPTTTSGQPALTVDKDKFDFGDVKLGQTVQVSFEVANTGAAPLRFKEKPYIEVATGC